LILMDFQMPEMGGIDAIAAIRAADIRIPIVALTAGVFKSDRDQCFAAGCAAFLAKPVSRRDLIATVVSITTTGGAKGPPPDEASPPAPEPPASSEPFDPTRLLQAIGGDEVLRDEILALTATNAPAQLAEVEAAVAAHDPAAIKAAAHKLKGALLAICASGASATAQRLEHAAVSGQQEPIEAHLAALKGEVERLQAAIAAFRAQGLELLAAQASRDGERQDVPPPPTDFEHAGGASPSSSQPRLGT
jgi:HPt (histidine-containing phosphotransfer) domain-containing protein